MSSILTGCGESIITPELGVSMAGYFEDRLSTVVHDDLYAKAMIFSNGIVSAGILCCDLICLPREEILKIRKIVSEKTDLKGENLMICCTHTHTGPRTRISKVSAGGEVTLKWLKKFPDLAAEAVLNAFNNMDFCDISSGKVMEDRIAFNRRYHMKDGTVQTNPGNQNPNIVKPAGPIDPEVGVISFTREDGSIKALYISYTCHLDNVGGTEISADYPGHLARRLAERLDDKPFVLYTNGACGDINHIDVRSPYRRKGHEHSRWMGETLAGDACKALNNMEGLSDENIGVASKIIQLPMQDYADKDTGKVEIQAIRVGDMGFVGVPAEYFVELQLDIKERSPFKWTFVSELANGWVGYIPTKKAFEENMKDVPSTSMKIFDHKGYEVRSALSRGLLPGVGELMADTCVELLEILK
ncbi:hypothetical protein GF312_19740 [Candidatus Poribacteria bacterium]|nr:hypothetical protein [Candidatus Poribacteria bacterium]